MSLKPVTMEQLNQILQLKNDGIGIREIACRTDISCNSVRKYLALLDAPAPAAELTNKELADKTYNNDQLKLNAQKHQQLFHHFQSAQSELAKTGITRQLLWKEYLQQHPNGYGYSQYCYHLNQHLKNKDVTMHLEYNPSDMLMIDFAGKKQHYVDAHTGERFECQVFVAVLPFSGLIFCHDVPSQQTHDFARCINAMLRFYAGLPATILCDNLKTAVKSLSRY